MLLFTFLTSYTHEHATWTFVVLANEELYTYFARLSIQTVQIKEYRIQFIVGKFD